MKNRTKPIPPRDVVLSELGLMPIVNGLRDEFPTLNKSTVSRWGKYAGRTGTVPSRYHQPLLRLAHRLGKNLTADDLVFGRRG